MLKLGWRELKLACLPALALGAAKTCFAEPDMVDLTYVGPGLFCSEHLQLFPCQTQALQATVDLGHPTGTVGSRQGFDCDCCQWSCTSLRRHQLKKL